jgi:predicted aspartyl protease
MLGAPIGGNGVSGRLVAALAVLGPLICAPANAAPLSSPFTLPVTLVDGYIIVDVRVNGQGPFHFLFDTGAGIVLLDPLAETLALNAREWGYGLGDGEQRVHMRRAEISDLQVGRLHLGGHVAGLLPPEDVRADFGSYPLSGFIGTPLLEKMAVKLDYVHRQITFTPSEQFSYSGAGTVLPFNARHLTAKVDGLEQSFFVDTGTKPGITLGTLTCNTYGLSERYAASAPSVTDWGAGGAVRTQLARDRLVELGDVQLHDTPLYLSVQKAGSLASTEGHIGAGLLSRFDVTFDTARSRIILEKNSSFDHQERYDRLGMWLSQEGDHFTVFDVVKGGPADVAGVKAGDVVLEIDNAPTANLVLPYVRGQLGQKNAGDQVKFLLQSADTKRSATVILQDRI